MRKLLFVCSCLWYCALFGQRIPLSDSLALEALQTIYDESCPLITTDGKTLYFSRKGHPQNVGDDEDYDIWVSFRKTDESWAKAIHMPLPINNRTDNFVVSPSADGQRLYLLDGKPGQDAKLVYTKKQGRIWSDPQPVIIQNFNPSPSTQYAMADNNRVMFFSASLDGGYGAGDIYVSTKLTETSWMEPVNLGHTINSDGNECHAYLAADNKTLYFLRKGLEPTDDMTLMISQRLGSGWTDWSEPKRTDIVLDSEVFDSYFSMAASGRMMYISGRKNANRDQELFAFSLPDQYRPEPVALIMGQLVDAKTGNKLDGNVVLESLSSFKESQLQQTNRKGRFQFVLTKESAFNLSAEVPGYFAKSEVIASESIQELDKDDNADAPRDDVFPPSPELDQLQMRLQQLDKAIKELEQERALTQLAIDKHKRINWSPSRNQEQLAALEIKYQEALGMNAINEKITSTGDSELDAMKRAYLKHNDVRPTSSDHDNTGSPTINSEESQLEAMKRKFNEVNNNTKKESPKEEAVVASATASEYPSFMTLVEQSRSALENELSDQVAKELRADLIQEVSFKIHAGMDSKSRDQYANTLHRKTEMLESEVRKELRKKYKNEVKRELRGELLEVVEAELRNVLREEVKNELRAELEDEVRKELRLELEYLLTKEMAADTKKEVASLIKQLRKTSVPTPGQYYSGDNIARTQQKRGTNLAQEINLELYRLTPGQIIPLPNIFFEANSDIWKDSSLPELNRVYDLLNNNPALVVELGGHSNGWCSTAFANRLSTDRAKAVADFLLRRGISSDRISWKGYGKVQPLVPNDSVENCKKNQRIELMIVKS